MGDQRRRGSVMDPNHSVVSRRKSLVMDMEKELNFPLYKISSNDYFQHQDTGHKINSHSDAESIAAGIRTGRISAAPVEENKKPKSKKRTLRKPKFPKKSTRRASPRLDRMLKKQQEAALIKLKEKERIRRLQQTTVLDFASGSSWSSLKANSNFYQQSHSVLDSDIAISPKNKETTSIQLRFMTSKVDDDDDGGGDDSIEHYHSYQKDGHQLTSVQIKAMIESASACRRVTGKMAELNDNLDEKQALFNKIDNINKLKRVQQHRNKVQENKLKYGRNWKELQEQNRKDNREREQERLNKVLKQKQLIEEETNQIKLTKQELRLEQKEKEKQERMKNNIIRRSTIWTTTVKHICYSLHFQRMIEKIKAEEEYRISARKIQLAFRSKRAKIIQHRLLWSRKIIGRVVYQWILKYRSRKLTESADIIRSFLSQKKKPFRFIIKSYRYKVVRCQRYIREFLLVTKARITALEKMWLVQFRIFNKSMKIQKIAALKQYLTQIQASIDQSVQTSESEKNGPNNYKAKAITDATPKPRLPSTTIHQVDKFSPTSKSLIRRRQSKVVSLLHQPTAPMHSPVNKNKAFLKPHVKLHDNSGVVVAGQELSLMFPHGTSMFSTSGGKSKTIDCNAANYYMDLYLSDVIKLQIKQMSSNSNVVIDVVNEAKRRDMLLELLTRYRKSHNSSLIHYKKQLKVRQGQAKVVEISDVRELLVASREQVIENIEQHFNAKVNHSIELDVFHRPYMRIYSVLDDKTVQDLIKKMFSSSSK